MRLLFVSALLVGLAGPVLAQQRTLTTPRVSPHAHVEQTVGLTELSVDYHRPAVRGREVFGGLVKWDEVWRAGANENTVFEASTDVVVEGEPLAAGRYGLHVIPRETGAWTVIFSTFADAWGSYFYDEAEDALRVEVTPMAAPAQEHLAYRIDPTADGALVTLHWAEIALPFRIDIDTDAVVLASMERELRSVPGFFAEAWDQIARYALDAGTRLEDALSWSDASIGRQASFANRMTKVGLLTALGRAEEADRLRDEAFANADEGEVRAWARTRQRAGDEAGAQEALDRIASGG